MEAENKALEEPLRKAREVRDKLKEELR